MTRLFCKAFFVIIISCCYGWAQEPDDPFASKEDAPDTPALSSDKTSSSSSGWRGTAVAINGSDRITSGGIGCPVIVVGSVVFSTEKLERQTELEIDHRSYAQTALSSDGSYFAIASKLPNQSDTSVNVMDVSTGKKVSEISGAKDEYLDVLLITRNKYVVTAE